MHFCVLSSIGDSSGGIMERDFLTVCNSVVNANGFITTTSSTGPRTTNERKNRTLGHPTT